jgi:23S rRNA (adenine1618-N6)-methyltransferase
MNATRPGALHPRNRHQGTYDFAALKASHPTLEGFLTSKANGGQIIDFAAPNAVKALNAAILSHDYGIENWEIPEGYLCPPVPGRADYLHYLSDLLNESNDRISTGNTRILDIGTGANAIYALLGATIYGWNMIGSEIDKIAIEFAKHTLSYSPALASKIELRYQANPQRILKGIIRNDELFDAVICNPPFYSSEDTANRANRKKQEKHLKLGLPVSLGKRTFQGQSRELFCEGGERRFIENLVFESRDYSEQCKWFTTLVSRQSTLAFIQSALAETKVADSRIISMRHGNKYCRIIAWTYQNPKPDVPSCPD